ncbi:cell division protein FtsL [Paenisporosarcina indica]|uniref:cell division protein FtsL n=1 Tax=Paenisporosarcina indica TaxID=650093 RepID=UPI0009502FFB|nr:cell division protein FtsL [Paenisporosarcina indica]
MAMHARTQTTYIKQPVVNPQPAVQPAIRPNRKIFTKGEKVLLVLFVSVFTLFSVIILQTQSSIHASTQDIQAIENKIEETKKQNTDLSIQVSELSEYERVWEKAKSLGLKLNEKNVKVVPGQ